MSSSVSTSGGRSPAVPSTSNLANGNPEKSPKQLPTSRRETKRKIISLQTMLRSQDLSQQHRGRINDDIQSLLSHLERLPFDIPSSELTERRRFLAEHADLHDIFQALWQVFFVYTDKAGHLTEEGYVKCQCAVLKCLLNLPGDDALALSVIASDFQQDSLYFNHKIDESAFYDVLFEIIETWTEILQPSYLTALTWALLDNLCDVESQPLKLRPLREISCITTLHQESVMLNKYIKRKRVRAALAIETHFLARIPEVQKRLQTRKQGLQDQTDAHRAMLDAWAHLHKDEVDKATGGGGAEGDEDDNSDDDHDNLSHQPSSSDEEDDEDDFAADDIVANPPKRRPDGDRRRSTISFLNYVASRKSILQKNSSGSNGGNNGNSNSNNNSNNNANKRNDAETSSTADNKEDNEANRKNKNGTTTNASEESPVVPRRGYRRTINVARHNARRQEEAGHAQAAAEGSAAYNNLLLAPGTGLSTEEFAARAAVFEANLSATSNGSLPTSYVPGSSLLYVHSSGHGGGDQSTNGLKMLTGASYRALSPIYSDFHRNNVIPGLATTGANTTAPLVASSSLPTAVQQSSSSSLRLPSNYLVYKDYARDRSSPQSPLVPVSLSPSAPATASASAFTFAVAADEQALDKAARKEGDSTGTLSIEQEGGRRGDGQESGPRKGEEIYLFGQRIDTADAEAVAKAAFVATAAMKSNQHSSSNLHQNAPNSTANNAVDTADMNPQHRHVGSASLSSVSFAQAQTRSTLGTPLFNLRSPSLHAPVPQTPPFAHHPQQLEGNQPSDLLSKADGNQTHVGQLPPGHSQLLNSESQVPNSHAQGSNSSAQLSNSSAQLPSSGSPLLNATSQWPNGTSHSSPPGRPKSVSFGPVTTTANYLTSILPTTSPTRSYQQSYNGSNRDPSQLVFNDEASGNSGSNVAVVTYPYPEDTQIVPAPDIEGKQHLHDPFHVTYINALKRAHQQRLTLQRHQEQAQHMRLQAEIQRQQALAFAQDVYDTSSGGGRNKGGVKGVLRASDPRLLMVPRGKKGMVGQEEKDGEAEQEEEEDVAPSTLRAQLQRDVDDVDATRNALDAFGQVPRLRPNSAQAMWHSLTQENDAAMQEAAQRTAGRTMLGRRQMKKKTESLGPHAVHTMRQTTSSTTSVSLRDLIPRDSDEDNRAALETLALFALAEDQRKEALESESHHNPNQHHKKKQTKEDVMLEQLMAHLPQGALGTMTTSFTNPEPSVTSSVLAEKMQEAQRTVENLQKAIVQVRQSTITSELRNARQSMNNHEKKLLLLQRTEDLKKQQRQQRQGDNNMSNSPTRNGTGQNALDSSMNGGFEVPKTTSTVPNASKLSSAQSLTPMQRREREQQAALALRTQGGTGRYVALIDPTTGQKLYNTQQSSAIGTGSDGHTSTSTPNKANKGHGGSYTSNVAMLKSMHSAVVTNKRLSSSLNALPTTLPQQQKHQLELPQSHLQAQTQPYPHHQRGAFTGPRSHGGISSAASSSVYVLVRPSGNTNNFNTTADHNANTDHRNNTSVVVDKNTNNSHVNNENDTNTRRPTQTLYDDSVGSISVTSQTHNARSQPHTPQPPTPLSYQDLLLAATDPNYAMNNDPVQIQRPNQQPGGVNFLSVTLPALSSSRPIQSQSVPPQSAQPRLQQPPPPLQPQLQRQPLSFNDVLGSNDNSPHNSSHHHNRFHFQQEPNTTMLVQPSSMPLLSAHETSNRDAYNDAEDDDKDNFDDPAYHRTHRPLHSRVGMMDEDHDEGEKEDEDHADDKVSRRSSGLYLHSLGSPYPSTILQATTNASDDNGISRGRNTNTNSNGGNQQSIKKHQLAHKYPLGQSMTTWIKKAPPLQPMHLPMNNIAAPTTTTTTIATNTPPVDPEHSGSSMLMSGERGGTMLWPQASTTTALTTSVSGVDTNGPHHNHSIQNGRVTVQPQVPQDLALQSSSLLLPVSVLEANQPPALLVLQQQQQPSGALSSTASNVVSGTSTSLPFVFASTPKAQLPNNSSQGGHSGGSNVHLESAFLSNCVLLPAAFEVHQQRHQQQPGTIQHLVPRQLEAQQQYQQHVQPLVSPPSSAAAPSSASSSASSAFPLTAAPISSEDHVPLPTATETSVRFPPETTTVSIYQEEGGQNTGQKPLLGTVSSSNRTIVVTGDDFPMPNVHAEVPSATVNGNDTSTTALDAFLNFQRQERRALLHLPMPTQEQLLQSQAQLRRSRGSSGQRRPRSSSDIGRADQGVRRDATMLSAEPLLASSSAPWLPKGTLTPLEHDRSDHVRGIRDKLHLWKHDVYHTSALDGDRMAVGAVNLQRRLQDEAQRAFEQFAQARTFTTTALPSARK